LGDFVVKLAATGQVSSVDCTAVGRAVCLEISEFKPVAGLLPFSSALSKLIANRMLPRPANNCNTNSYLTLDNAKAII